MTDLYLRTKRSDFPDQTFLGTQPFVFGEGTNDLQIDSNQDLQQVSSTDKLSQDIIKILITQRGTNPLFSLYGSNLQSMVGQKNDPQFLSGQILSEVRDTLVVLQSINQNNPNLDEQIQTLQSLRVNLDSPTQISIQLVVITKSQKSVGAIVTIVA